MKRTCHKCLNEFHTREFDAHYRSCKPRKWTGRSRKPTSPTSPKSSDPMRSPRSMSSAADRDHKGSLPEWPPRRPDSGAPSAAAGAASPPPRPKPKPRAVSKPPPAPPHLVSAPKKKKAAPEQWRCVLCTFQNPWSEAICPICQQGERPPLPAGVDAGGGAARPKSPPVSVPEKAVEPPRPPPAAVPVVKAADPPPEPEPKYWKCDKCTFLNPCEAPACVICTTAKPAGIGGPSAVADPPASSPSPIPPTQPKKRPPPVHEPEPEEPEEEPMMAGGMDLSGLDPETRAMLLAEFCVKCRAEQGEEVSSVCGHKVCLGCVKGYLEEGLRSKRFRSQPVTCLARGCKEGLPDWFMRRSGLSESLQARLEEDRTHFMMSSDDTMTQCPECNNYFSTEVGDMAVVAKSTEVGLDGKPLTALAQRHKARWRFRCAVGKVECKCATIFCGNCKAVPYHLGYTCEEFEKYREAKKCRFCEKALTEADAAPLEAGMGPGLKWVCTEEECLEKRKWSCDKIHPCGHECIGIRGERRCLPCANPECVAEDTDEDFCNICWVEPLKQAPTIHLRCGHKFHFMCIWRKIERKWPAARITFGFLNCPLCKAEIHHDAMSEMSKKYYDLRDEIQKEAVERLAIEGLDGDKRIKDPSSPYFNNVEKFAMDRLAFYMCSKCSKPYFGGMKACEEAGMEQAEAYKKEHLVCGACASGPSTKSCKKHGKKYITYKCKFCCGIGTWFCWGSTHFCDSCHKKQEKGTYLNRLPIDALPKCPGVESCPLGIEHPANGTAEFSLGCVVCLRR